MKHAQLLTWLKTDMELGHGHVNAIILYLQDPEMAKKIAEDQKHTDSRILSTG